MYSHDRQNDKIYDLIFVALFPEIVFVSIFEIWNITKLQKEKYQNYKC